MTPTTKPKCLTRYHSMVNALHTIRSCGEDIPTWLASHIGHVYEETRALRLEVALLKSKLTRLQKKHTKPKP